MKKGQAAFEYMSIYGWAIMVAIIAIGALTYFGIFDFSKYSPKRCNFGSQFVCGDSLLQINASSSNAPLIKIKLTNNLGTTVNISANGINATNDEKIKLQCTASPPSGITWNDGDTKDFAINCAQGTGMFYEGDKIKVIVKIVFYDPMTVPQSNHVVYGEIYDEVSKTS